MEDDSTTTVPTLVRRRLQAQVIGPIHAEMVAAIGKEKADSILDGAIRKAAIAEAEAFATKAGKTSMADFIKLYELWTHDGSLEIEVLAADDQRFLMVQRAEGAKRGQVVVVEHWAEEIRRRPRN